MCHETDCDCGQHTHHPHSGGWHHRDCCCTPGYGFRQFPTREETIAEMEEYLKQLQAKAKAVEERLTELKK